MEIGISLNKPVNFCKNPCVEIVCSFNYSHLTNKHGGWINHGWAANVAKSVNVEIGINVEGGIFWKRQVRNSNKQVVGGKNLRNQ